MTIHHRPDPRAHSPSNSTHGAKGHPNDDQRTLVLTAAEAARVLAISERHFRSLVCSGHAPQPVRLGRRTLWSVRSIQDWLEAGAPTMASGRSTR